MNQLLYPVSLACLILSLNGCSLNVSSDSDADTPLSDDAATVDEVSPPLSDALIAPTSPDLTIAASPGELQFSWIDNENAPITNTVVSLYEHDSLTGLETVVAGDIGNQQNEFSVAIEPHRLAWERKSYRVEICTLTNCLSSFRTPVDTLLSDATAVIQPDNADQFPGFASNIALNDNGTLALASNPLAGNASIHFNNGSGWFFAGTLAPLNIEATETTKLQIASSSTGDTIAIAAISENQQPTVTIFDRLGESWIETDSFFPVNTNLFQVLVRSWDTESLQLELSASGDRLIFSAQQIDAPNSVRDGINNTITVFERGIVNWAATESLTVPAQQQRLSTISASVDIDSVVALSTDNISLTLHEYRLNNGLWQTFAGERLGGINPALDNVIVSSSNGAEVAIASWEVDSLNQGSPVAWRLENSAGGWISTDSIRLPSITDTSAELRLAADGTLDNLALGWQAGLNANLSFFANTESQWERLFNLPRALSVTISEDGSVATVGAAGGFFGLSSAAP